MSGTYKQFTGNAVVAHLTAAITGTPSSFTVDTATGFPTGAGSVPFVVTVDRGTSTEEKILCSSQGSGVFTIQTRGWDGTTQQNHSNGATVEHTLDADTLNDSQQHIHVTTRDDHTQYARTDGTRAITGQQTFSAGLSTQSATITGLTGATAASRLAGGTASGAPSSGTFAVGDVVVDQTGIIWACTAAGPPAVWNQIGVANAAWTTYTPTFTASTGTAPALGNGTLPASYVQQGKLVTVRFHLNAGTTTTFGSGGTLEVSLPTSALVVNKAQVLHGTHFDGTNNYPAFGLLNSAAAAGVQLYTAKGGTSGDFVPYTNANASVLDGFSIQGVYEAQ